jgi:hypothetical protein
MHVTLNIVTFQHMVSVTLNNLICLFTYLLTYLLTHLLSRKFVSVSFDIGDIFLHVASVLKNQYRPSSTV